jgi:pilus assembly protein CpaC
MCKKSFINDHFLSTVPVWVSVPRAAAVVGLLGGDCAQPITRQSEEGVTSVRLQRVTIGAVAFLVSIWLLAPIGSAQTNNVEQTDRALKTLFPPKPYRESAKSARGHIQLDVSQGATIRLTQPAANIFVSDPSIADLQPASNEVIFVFGKAPGHASLFALNDQGEAIAEYKVVVTRPVDELRVLLQNVFGDHSISVTYTPNGAVLTGTVPDAATAEKVQALTAQFLPQGAVITNMLGVGGAVQVNLKVRVAEVSRTVSKEFGFNLSATGKGGNFQFGVLNGRQFVDAAGQAVRSSTGAGTAFMKFSTGALDITAALDALAAEGLVSILAEPNLTAVSGTSANFLAGGEFPIPVIQGSGQGNAVTIERQRFGVSLEFTPTVFSRDHIRIHVRPEVSDISNRGAVKIQGIDIPALVTHRAETVVELGSGQSFAIGGLIRKGFNTEVSKFPGLGDLPILGELFRSSSFQKDESELVIIVTPYIVRPARSPAALQVPTDRVAPPSDTGRVLRNEVAKPPPTQGSPMLDHIRGVFDTKSLARDVNKEIPSDTGPAPRKEIARPPPGRESPPTKSPGSLSDRGFIID